MNRRNLLLWVGFVSILLHASAGNGNSDRLDGRCAADSLKFVRTFQLTTDAEGGGARPEILSLQDKFYIAYRVLDLVDRSGRYDAQIYDALFENGTRVEGIVVEDEYGAPTDVQLATDGSDIFAAYEKVRADTHFLFSEKLDSALERVAGPKLITSHIAPFTWGDEKLDDPSPFIADDTLCLVTYFHHRYAGENHFRVRHFDVTSLDSLGPPVDVSVNPFNPMVNNVSSQIYKGTLTYFVFAGENKHDASQAPHDSSAIVVAPILSDYSSIGASYTVVDGSQDTTMNVRPSGFIFDEGRFYISHQTVKQLIPYRSGGDVFLRVFDSEFNPIQNVTVLDTAVGHHTTVALRGKKVYVAYQVANDSTNSIPSNVFVSEYEWMLKGDVNGDDSINIIDALLTVRYILKQIDFMANEFWRADCNGDEAIDVLDVVGIVNIILGAGTCSPARS